MNWLEVDVISLTDKRRIPMPLRVRYVSKNGARSVDIDRIVSFEKKIAAGEDYVRYQCRAVNHNDLVVEFVLQYWLSDCYWQMGINL